MGKLNTKYYDNSGILNDLEDYNGGNWIYTPEQHIEEHGKSYEQLASELIEMFEKLPDPLPVYRSITTDTPPKSFIVKYIERDKPLGIYWAWDEYNAEPYWGKEEHRYRIRLNGTVPKKFVDWDTTLLASLHYWEGEITLFEGAKVNLVSIKSGGNIFPINKTVTAIKKTAELTKQDIYEFYELEYKIDQLKRRNPDHRHLMKMEGRLNIVCNKIIPYLTDYVEANLELNEAMGNDEENYEESISYYDEEKKGTYSIPELSPSIVLKALEKNDPSVYSEDSKEAIRKDMLLYLSSFNIDNYDDYVKLYNKTHKQVKPKKELSWMGEKKKLIETLNKAEKSGNLGEKIASISEALNWYHAGGSMKEILSEDIGISYDFLTDLSNGKFTPQWNKELQKIASLRPIKKFLRNLLDTRGDLKKVKSVFEGDYLEDEDDYREMTPEDYENIRQTDKVTSDEATDMSKIPHPQKYEEVEGLGMFFIGGDNMGIGMSGEESLHGADYAKAFQGWAVGKDRLQILEKKADEGYYYVGIVIYKDPTKSTFRNPAFISSLDRKLKYISTGLDVDYNSLKEEAHKELFTKRLDKDATPSMFGYLGEKVPEDIKFFRKVIDLLKKKESERGEDKTIFMSKILEEVADEASSKKNRGAYGKIIGVGKFAEGLRGEDRVVKHELYPEEVIFSNYVELPDPIDFTELVPALREIHTDVEEKHLLGTLWARLNGYNLTLPKSIPLVQELMDLADRGDVQLQKSAGLDWDKLQKLARLKKTANLEVGTRDGQKVMLKLEDLPDKKQRENFLSHYMNGSFEVDGVWYKDLDAIEQGKARIHFNNLKYL